MKTICEVLDVAITPVIYAIAILELLLMFKSLWIMFNFKCRIQKLNKKEIKKSNKKKTTKGQVEKTIEMEENRNWDEFDQFLEDYQRQSCCYTAFSMIIQIFTLLGILGTVVGLYLAMSNGQDMYSGVELALSTTILGIMFAAFYKVFDILITSVFINYIEDGINRYEKIYKIDNEDATIAAVIGNSSN